MMKRETPMSEPGAPGARSEETDSPAYPLEPIMELSTPKQFSALGDPVRQTILDLLADRAATTRELASALGSPVSTVAHHLRVLQGAGLIRVVRTRQARAMTERYYGRAARRFVSVSRSFTQRDQIGLVGLRRALTELEADLAHEGTDPGGRFQSYVSGRARLTPNQVETFIQRLTALVDELEGQSTPEGTTVDIIAVLYRTGQPELPPESVQQDDEGHRSN